MTMLIVAALYFLALHLMVAGTRLRDAIVDAVGERPYLGLFSLASLAGIVWLAISYTMTSRDGPAVLWDFGPGVSHMGIPIVGLAFLLGVTGLLMPNPTSLGQEGAATREGTVRGVLRITRHPFLWGVALWAAVASAVLALGISLVLPMRVSENAEREGLDLASHGERAWELD